MPAQPPITSCKTSPSFSRGRICEQFEALQVVNTFITTGSVRSPSLEPFLQDREVSSCPASPLGKRSSSPNISDEYNAKSLDSLALFELDFASNRSTADTEESVYGQTVKDSALWHQLTDEVDEECQSNPNSSDDESASTLHSPALLEMGFASQRSTADTEEPLDGRAVADSAIGPQHAEQMFRPWSPYNMIFAVEIAGFWECKHSSSWPTPIISQPLPALTPLVAIPPQPAALPVLRLEKALDFAPPMPDSTTCVELSIGSIDHHSGQCRPCAFFYATVGCGNGGQCSFCHLCGPDEKRHRRTEKRALRSAMKQIRVLRKQSRASAGSLEK